MQFMCVGLPIESTAMSTPRLPVHARTCLDQSCPSSSTSSSAPSSFARSSFHSWREVTTTGHAIHFAIASAAVATPPPMPVISTACPGLSPPLVTIIE